MSGVALGRIAGVPIRADGSAGFILLFVVVSRSGDGGEGALAALVFGVVIMVSILVHELGHAIVGKWVGLKPLGILIHGFGGLCRYDRAPVGLRGVLVSAAGPAAGLLLGALAFVVLLTTRGYVPAGVATMLGDVVMVNLFWSLFNLLPMFPMDGGSVLLHGIEARWGFASAMRITRWASIVTAIAVGAGALYIGSFFIAIIAGFVLFQNMPRRGR
jgi:Zn-dependent protease